MRARRETESRRRQDEGVPARQHVRGNPGEESGGVSAMGQRLGRSLGQDEGEAGREGDLCEQGGHTRGAAEPASPWARRCPRPPLASLHGGHLRPQASPVVVLPAPPLVRRRPSPPCRPAREPDTRLGHAPAGAPSHAGSGELAWRRRLPGTHVSAATRPRHPAAEAETANKEPATPVTSSASR